VEAEFNQRFQEVLGLAHIDGQVAQMWEARLTGDRLSFVIVDAEDRENEASLYFEGTVLGDRIEGEVRRGVGKGQDRIKWQAVRVSR
jgi:hypothetical protein